MIFKETDLKDCYVIEPKPYPDNRGQFYEGFNNQKFKEFTGLEFQLDQLNCSISKKFVLRGLHFQKPPFDQAKIVFVTKGEVLDVVVDLRRDSPSYLRTFSIRLSEDNKTRLFVPKGFAHGFIALKDEVHLSYLVDGKYNPEMDSGIVYNDPELNIDWGVPEEDAIISDKDRILGSLDEAKNIF